MLRYLAAAGFALPIGAIGWFELNYLFFGFTGEDPSPLYGALSAAGAFGVAIVWPLAGTSRAAEVVRRSCRLGWIAAGLLPVVCVAVLLMWERSGPKQELGMGGLLFYGMAVAAFAAGLMLALALWLCDRSAARRLQ